MSAKSVVWALIPTAISSYKTLRSGVMDQMRAPHAPPPTSDEPWPEDTSWLEPSVFQPLSRNKEHRFTLRVGDPQFHETGCTVDVDWDTRTQKQIDPVCRWSELDEIMDTAGTVEMCADRFEKCLRNSLQELVDGAGPYVWKPREGESISDSVAQWVVWKAREISEIECCSNTKTSAKRTEQGLDVDVHVKMGSTWVLKRARAPTGQVETSTYTLRLPLRRLTHEFTPYDLSVHDGNDLHNLGPASTREDRLASQLRADLGSNQMDQGPAFNTVLQLERKRIPGASDVSELLLSHLNASDRWQGRVRIEDVGGFVAINDDSRAQVGRREIRVAVSVDSIHL